MPTVSPAERIFILAGAGVSAESGIPTFHGMGGVNERRGIWGVRRSVSAGQSVALCKASHRAILSNGFR
jgi:NAD-dependent SIR2 family protein deacetylase